MNNFVNGIAQIGHGFYYISASVAKLFGYQVPTYEPHKQLTDVELAQQDAKVIAKDWQRVGDDMWRAMGIERRNHNC